VQSVCADLHLDDATLDAHQTLELVLCCDFVCFRSLRIDGQEIDIPAALDGQVNAQQALKEQLTSALQALL
jgi:hypothetical protein